jgi:hypothetical protein
MESVFHPGSSTPSPSSGNRWLGRISKGKLKNGFISLQQLQTGTGTGDTGNESNAEKLTETDSKLMAMDQLLVAATVEDDYYKNSSIMRAVTKQAYLELKEGRSR